MEFLQLAFAIIFLIFFSIFILLYLNSLLNSIIYKVPQVWTFASDFKVMRSWLKKYNLKWKKLVDLWSWTWKVLRFFEKEFKTKTTWYEIDLWNIVIAKILNKLFSCNANIYKSNYLKADLSTYDYIYVYLYPELIEKIEEKIWNDCKKWTIIFSNAFKFKKHIPIEILKDSKAKEEIFIYKKN